MSFSSPHHPCPCFLPSASLASRKPPPSTKHPRSPPRSAAHPPSPRDQLYTLATSANSRTHQNSQLESLIPALESLPHPHPARSPHLIGTWRNAFTTTPSTSSIIQRAVVSSALVPRVEQLILPAHDHTPAAILNRVDLRKPLGCILNVRAAVENVQHSRLSIRFDKAWFEFDRLPVWLGAARLPSVFHLPYPVPFRLLGDKACGWLDITYLDSDMRISRGNRGSCFVLIKEHEHADTLPLTSQHVM